MSAKHTKHNLFLYAERVFYVALTKLFSRSFVINLMCFGRKKYKGYDVAISYIHEAPQKNLYGGCNEFILKMIEAGGGQLKLAAIETAAADQYNYYLSVLREMIDEGTVSHSGDTIKKM